MVIRLDYRVIFVHIPKTAGNSISAVLESLPQRKFPIDLRIMRKIRNIGRQSRELQRIRKHSTALSIKEWVGHYTWNRCFTFTIVRNPWDLMVSSYIWWLEKAEKWKIFQSSIDEIRKMGSFNNFMYSKYDREMINEVDTDLIDYITDSKGKVILKFIGRFENLEDDWRRICNNTGIGCRKLPNENRGGRDDYRKYYNDETRAIVAARFKKFIEMFGYEF